MRQETIEIYTLDELSETAQETAHENFLTSGFEWAWTHELVDTLKAFAEVFPVKIRHYEFDNNYADVTFEMTCDDEISELSGIRLAKYIWNNYKRDLFKGKYYGSYNSKEKVNHKRIRSTFYENSQTFGNYYYSAITLKSDCRLTGICFDCDILQPVYDFLNKPDSRDFEDLMRDCFEAWEKAAKSELSSQLTFEYFKDHAQANEYEFTSDGEMY